MILKTFDAPLTFYKYKDGVKDIAAALAIDQTGTVAELTACIQAHLHPEPTYT